MKLNILIIAAGTVALSIGAAHADVSTKTQDLNSDGVVTFQELMDSHATGIERTQAFVDRHKKIFDGADTNGDGVVDSSESQDGAAGKPKTKGASKS